MRVLQSGQVRVFTRHLARIILSFLTEKDLVVMMKVSREWRRFLMRELRPALFCRIRNLQIVELRSRKQLGEDDILLQVQS